MTRLTPNQTDAMEMLNNYVGQTVDILTSGYTANCNPEFVRRAVTTVGSAAIRGLESKGFIRIEKAFWKGATISVLKAA